MNEVEKFMAFIEHFNVSRPGNYFVPTDLLEIAYSHFLANGNIEPILNFEKVFFALWETDNNYVSEYSAEKAAQIMHLIDHDPYIGKEFNKEEKQKIRQLLGKQTCRGQNEAN